MRVTAEEVKYEALILSRSGPNFACTYSSGPVNPPMILDGVIEWWFAQYSSFQMVKTSFHVSLFVQIDRCESFWRNFHFIGPNTPTSRGWSTYDERADKPPTIILLSANRLILRNRRYSTYPSKTRRSFCPFFSKMVTFVDENRSLFEEDFAIDTGSFSVEQAARLW